MTERIWLAVPYAQKDEAKAAGARWDQRARSWYAPRPGIAGLDPWIPLPPVPQLLPGEDRTFGSGLFVDLVPSSCWFTNVRSCVDVQDWDRLRDMVYNRAGNVCEACGAGRDPRAGRWLEAHERWEYNAATHVQALRRLICLCKPCHEATHFGLANLRGRGTEATDHLRQVTGYSTFAINRHVEEAFAIWDRRSRQDWTLDLSILTTADIRLKPPPEAAARAHAARAEVSSRELDLSSWSSITSHNASNRAQDFPP